MRPLLALLVLLSACATGASPMAPAFDPRAIPNRSADNRAVLARLDTPEAASPGTEVSAVAVRADDGQLVALGWDGSIRWQAPLRAGHQPQLAGSTVVTTGPGGALHALDLETGTERFRNPLPKPVWVGVAALPGGLVSVSRSEDAASSEIRALSADGGTRWVRAVDGQLGAPASRGNLVVVPYRRQCLVALDATNGRELGRFCSRDDVLEWVQFIGQHMISGDPVPYALGADYAGTRPPATMPLPPAPIPPASLPFATRSAVASADATAAGGVGLRLALEATGAGPQLADDRIYQLLYRVVVAVNGVGELKWVATLPDDIVAAKPVPRGMVVLTRSGNLLLISRDSGSVTSVYRSKTELISGHITASPTSLSARLATAVDAQNVDPPTSPLRDEMGDHLSPLSRQLWAVASHPDARLLGAQAFAVRQLSTRPEPALTRMLLDLYGRLGDQSPLREVIATALAGRGEGASHLLAALEKRYNYLERTEPAPLELLVPLVRRLGERRATPLLIEHLFDPATPTPRLAELGLAIGELGGAEGQQALLRFLRMYRADSALGGLDGTLAALAAQLAEAGMEAELQALDGPTTHPAVRAVIAGLHAAPPTATIAEGAPPRGPAPSAAKTAPLPPRPAPAAVQAVFDRHRASFAHCGERLRVDNPELRQVRVALVIRGDGTSYGRAYAPAEVADCLEPVVAALRFPRFDAPRATAAYTLALRERPGATAPQNRPRWWTPFVRVAPLATPAATADGPWWRDRNPLVLDVPDGAFATDATAPTAGQPAPGQPAPADPAPLVPEPPIVQNATPVSPTSSPAAPDEAPGAAEAPPAEGGSTPWWAPVEDAED